MRNVSNWIWISVVAAALLGSGLVGLFGCPRPEQVWSAVETRFGPTQAAQAPIPAAMPAAAAPPAVTVVDPESGGGDAAAPPPADPQTAPAAAAPATDPSPVAASPAPVAQDAAPATPLAPLPMAPTAPVAAASPAPAAAAPAVPAAASTVAAAPAPRPTHRPLRVPLPSKLAPSNLTRARFVVVHRAPKHVADNDANPIAHSLVVDVLPEIRLAGASVQLDDLVRLHAPVGMAIPSIANVEVARISRQSVRSIAINRPLIRQTLVNQGIDMSHAVFTGANATRILPVRNVVQARDLMRVAQQYLMSVLTGDYHWRKANIHLRPIQQLQPVVVGPGRLVIEASRVDDRRPLGALGINLDLKLNGMIVKTVCASFQVQVMARVAEARHQVTAGNVIASDDVRLVERDLGSLPEGVVTDLSHLVGKVAQWTMRPGMILTEGMAMVPPVVAQNGSVTIHYQSGNVEMTLVGRALKDGQKGDVIPVKAVDTGKTFDAIVVDRDNVEVGPEPDVSYQPAARPDDPQPAPSTAPHVVQRHAVAPGTTVIAPSGPLPMWGPSPHFSEQQLPVRSAAVTPKGPKLPGPNYATAPAANGKTHVGNPYFQMSAALGNGHRPSKAMFDLRQKALPLH